VLLVAVAWLRPPLRVTVLVLLAALGVTQLVELILKNVLDHPGPPGIGRTLFELGGGPQTQGSFPSGHMIRAIVLGGGTALLAGRRAGLAVAAAYIVAMASTRLYLSEHWLSDVIGGALLGLAALPIIALVVPRTLRVGS
jgi:undecaprenyl-diphosphatase